MDTRSIVLSSISKKRNSKNKSHQEYYFIDRTFAKSKNSGDLLRGGFVLGSYRAALKRFLTGIISD
ncbi:hypothetical protein LEP1GSC071_4112 [Leptospira santarosai str. JET]|nr:hypothetical protein LEP1GSC071_4112 [Leptospira santarosai str. JET]